jgi:hypothetical protein
LSKNACHRVPVRAETGCLWGVSRLWVVAITLLLGGAACALQQLQRLSLGWGQRTSCPSCIGTHIPIGVLNVLWCTWQQQPACIEDLVGGGTRNILPAALIWLGSSPCRAPVRSRSVLRS